MVAATMDDDRDDGLVAGILDLYTFTNAEGNFQALQVVLVVHDRGFVDGALTLCPRLGVDDEEVLERSVHVISVGEVGEVVAELHGLGVQLAVGPAAQHGHFGSGVAVTVVTVTGIGEVYERNGLLGLGGIEVGADAGAQCNLATAAIVHLQFDGAERTIVLAYTVYLGSPEVVGYGAVAIEGGYSVGIGTIDESLVLPQAP